MPRVSCEVKIISYCMIYIHPTIRRLNLLIAAIL